MFSKFEKVDGICPIKLLWDRFNTLIWSRFPSSCGISPVKLLQERSIPDM
uniref:Uncharacterized protein MANES_14G137100 n=1 Tax=Rhizophora mucronata TaxID=61149 RepID=A0A2P2LNF8_RHIMU